MWYKDYLKHEIACALNDNMHNKWWHNYVDYAIICLIILSTLEVFLSTYDSILERYGNWLLLVDHLTTICFTVEVTLRIWVADQIDPAYKGLRGRLRYCFSFYGFIDVISTYPFYLHYFMPVPYVALKVFRILRLMRIFRYIKAFSILKRALYAKKSEMIVSLQFLTIITVLLSFILFFVEHKAQPDVYDNGCTSVIWAFAQYIGDPGKFANTPPVTFWGQVIACMVGVLGIAIFAVPSGLIASAFVEVMNEDQHKENSKNWASKVYNMFQRKQDRITGFQISPKCVSIAEIQARVGLKVDEIIDAVAYSNKLRLINLSVTQPIEEHPNDRLAVEYFEVNTAYGMFIDRGSKVTIVTVSNIVDPIVGWWGFYLAKFGGFNYVSRETGAARPYQSYLKYNQNSIIENQELFMSDINRLCNSKDKWLFVINASSGSLEPTYPTQFHFNFGAHKGGGYDDSSITINDIDTFESLYVDFEALLKNKYNLFADKQKYHSGSNKELFYRHLEHKLNVVSIRVAWSVMCWDPRAIQIANDLASKMNKYMGNPDYRQDEVLKIKDIGYNGYDIF